MAVGQASRPVPAVPAISSMPAVPAMSQNSNSVVDNHVLLKIVEDNTWFNELESGPDPVSTGEQTAVRD